MSTAVVLFAGTVFINELSVYVQVWPGATHFPDFLSKTGVKYWGQQLQAFHDLVPYDGLWIDMDEVSNFCTGDVCHMPQGRLCQGPAGSLKQCNAPASGLQIIYKWNQLYVSMVEITDEPLHMKADAWHGYLDAS